MQPFLKHFRCGIVAGPSLIVPPALAEEATVTALTQTSCQFLESEIGIEYGFHAAKA